VIQSGAFVPGSNPGGSEQAVNQSAAGAQTIEGGT